MKPLRLIAALALAAASLSAHAVGRLADVTIFDRATSREIPVNWHDGRAYVVGKPGNEYQVVVRNRSGEEILAVVSVDGVDVMNGETASPNQSGYVIAPWSRLDVRGWRKSMEETAAFYFTSLGDSYAARTDRPANVGVIGVAVFRAKRPEPPREIIVPIAPAPKMESERREMNDSLRSRAPEAAGARSMPAPGAPIGTGHGRREDSPVRWVQFERATSEPAETVAIYYDSYRNLVARGILRAAPVARDPRPFPGFVPDPC